MGPSFVPEVTSLNPEMHLHLPPCFGSFIDQYLCPVLDYLFTSRIKKKDRWADSISQFSRSIVSDSLQPHGLQHPRLPCLSPSPGTCSNSCESVMPLNHLILCCPLLLLPSIFPSIRIFSSESTLCIRWPKYWSFSLNSFLCQ